MAQSDVTRTDKYIDKEGNFQRPATVFRDHIAKNGPFKPEKGRYHLYVSYACPWAHRTLIVRQLKGLEDIVDVTVVSPRLGKDGWPFASVDHFPGAQLDPLYNSNHVKDLYLRVDSNYSARFSVPVLWDKQTETIVNNESSEIIRMLNSEFNDLIDDPAKRDLDLYPEEHRKGIDEINEWVYDSVNNGVYKAGVATTQPAYEVAVNALFASLDRLEVILKDKEYLIGGRLTEADVRLYVTAIRFDEVYNTLFKCNYGTIRVRYTIPLSYLVIQHNYPAINKWMKKLYWLNPAFKDTTFFDHIRTHYFWSLVIVNPTRVVPVGPRTHIEPL